ncbi:MAG: hypothetical protein RLZZ231_1266 [Bacteroidota bacterium]|jgi:hypothetical protein
MIEISNGKIFIDGIETTNPELIGLALLDFADEQAKDDSKIILIDGEIEN